MVRSKLNKFEHVLGLGLGGPCTVRKGRLGLGVSLYCESREARAWLGSSYMTCDLGNSDMELPLNRD